MGSTIVPEMEIQIKGGGCNTSKMINEKKTTSFENTEKRKWLLLRNWTWKSTARPPKHDCSARPTESSIKRKRNLRKVTRRKKDPSGVGKGWCTGDLKQRQTSSWNSRPRLKSRRLTRSEDDPIADAVADHGGIRSEEHGHRWWGGWRRGQGGGEGRRTQEPPFAVSWVVDRFRILVYQWQHIQIALTHKRIHSNQLLLTLDELVLQ